MPKDFDYQREIPYNRNLPYYERLEEEAVSLLAEIKFNFGRAVIFQELTPGVLVWCNRLATYLRVYGRTFSKEDHIHFIKIMYELVTIPDLEPQFVKGFSHSLIQLLSKVELLSRDDLQLPWRPLYQMIERIIYSKHQPIGLEKFPLKLAEAIRSVVKASRIYFPVDATQEILDEFRPLLCPFDVAAFNKGLDYLCLFLPTCMPPEEYDRGVRLWYDEILSLFVNYNLCHRNNQLIIGLLSRLAYDCVASVDWNSRTPQIFNWFLSSLQLPVGGQLKFESVDYFHTSVMALFTVYTLGGTSNTLDHVETLFKSIESFYYPSNYGRYSLSLIRFLSLIAEKFVERLHRERYKKPSWRPSIPPSFRLTDEEANRFVEIIKPVALLAMYSKTGLYDAASALQNLALVRPDIMLPPLIDRTFEALETVIEPHQVLATLSCLTGVSRVLIRGDVLFPQGPTYVLPILHQVLPGIDSNDFRKSMATFTLISAAVSLIPLVDCSSVLQTNMELTEIERELCSASAGFEDFVLQFLDRCFALVDNCTVEQTNQQDSIVVEAMDTQEGMLGMGLASTLHTVLIQSSPKIFQACLKKIFNFCRSRVMEVTVAGKMVADMCRAAVKANGEVTLKKFVPHCCSRIVSLAKVDGISEEENVDNELLWNLEVLSEIVRCSGVLQLPYRDQLIQVLDCTLHLKCKKAYFRACKILRGILASSTLIYSMEWRSSIKDFSEPPEEHLYIRDWGKVSDLYHLEMKWHLPVRAELEFADELVQRYLPNVLNKLEQYIEGEKFTKEELHQTLYIITVIIYGASGILRPWTDEPRVENLGPSSMVTRDRTFYITTTVENENFFSKITRKDIAVKIHRFLEYMLKRHEDDTKTFQMIAKIYSLLLLHFGVSQDEFDMRWKSMNTVKKHLEDKLHGKKRHVRAIFMERAQLQHDIRVLERQSTPFTKFDLLIINDLLQLSTSVYTEVRMKSQKILFSCFDIFDYSARAVLPSVLGKLKDSPEISHEEFKGALHVLLNCRMLYLVTHYWEVMVTAWPAIVQADHSEKPSMVGLIDKVMDKISRKFDSTAICRKVSDSCQAAAAKLLTSSRPVPATQHHATIPASPVLPTQDVLDHATQVVEKANETQRELYATLVISLVQILDGNNIRWRHAQICVSLLALLIRHDHPLPAAAVRVVVRLLTHDSLVMRKKAIRAMSALFQQQKAKHKKVEWSASAGGLDDRRDLLQYRRERALDTEEKWNSHKFVDKLYIGFQTWPKCTLTYAPVTEQPKFASSRDELDDARREIFDAFSSSDFVAKMIDFLSLEDKKGKDTFSSSRFNLFKGLFRNFGPVFLPVFMTHIEKLLSENLESHHRCASEIIAGMIRGSKHWTFQQLEEMWGCLIPLLKKVLTNIIPEMLDDWAYAIMRSTEYRDPYRFHRLFDLLLENPLNGEGGAFGDAARIHIIGNFIYHQAWKVAEVHDQLLSYFIPHLAHPYKKVRDKIGRLLHFIYLFDVPVTYPTQSPKLRDLVNKVNSELSLVRQRSIEMEEKLQFIHVNVDASVNHVVPEEKKRADVESLDDEEQHGVNLAKTILSLMALYANSIQPLLKDVFRLLPVFMPLEGREDDKELQASCRYVLTKLAEMGIPEESVPVALATLRQVAHFHSWNARSSCLRYLQKMAFHNLFTLNLPNIRNEIKSLVLELMEDSQLEVRELAGRTMSGLVHYGYIAVDQELQDTFSSMAKTRLRKAKRGAAGDGEEQRKYVESLQKRHAGVLGLAACVQAFPYAVPKWLPDMILQVGSHLHDPAPIQATVKKTLSDFKRTHHDSWHSHRQHFTDDQIAILADLLISPNYYA